LRRGDALVVWRLDRLGRSLIHLVQVINELAEHGTEFRSLSESIDTASSGGRLVFHIMAALAEFERSLISERTRAGMQAAKKKGKHVGRPKALSQEQIEVAKAAIKEGQPMADVAQSLGPMPAPWRGRWSENSHCQIPIDFKSDGHRLLEKITKRQ